MIREAVLESREGIALFTPWSAMPSWVWIEMGAAWGGGIPILAAFYGMTLSDLDTTGQGRAFPDDVNIIELNAFETYLEQLAERVRGTRS